MRNLRSVRHEALIAGAPVTALCWDAGTDEVLLTYGPTETNTQIELVRVTGFASLRPLECQTAASWPAPRPNPDTPADKVVSLHHFSGSLATCVVLAGGDIVYVQEEERFSGSGQSHQDAHVEIVGSVDAGITAACWSPDEELLALATDAGTVVFMSRSFDGTGVATMAAEDLGLSKHVSVGWGKKETQFRGKGAKALRDPTIPEKVDQGVLSAYDDGGTTISWRGDGAFVAVNSVETGSRRVIRVYTRDAVLDSVSEPVDGLEGGLSWRPAGNLIAGIQRRENSARVVFFERNGLRHGEFDLRLPKGYDDDGSPLSRSIRLEWNCDSTVLAVIYAGTVQLWTMGNYHWYLKQEISLQDSLPSLSWHPEKPLLFSASNSDRLLLGEYVFAVARGSLIPPDDYGAVAVVDGESLKITPFRSANIPPPMSMFDISTSSIIVDVTFSTDCSRVAVLHERSLDLFAWPRQKDRFSVPKLIAQSALQSQSAHAHDRPAAMQICFRGDGEILVLCSAVDTKILHYEIPGSDSGALRLKDVQTSKPIFGLLPSWRADRLVYGQELSGRLVSVENNALHDLPASFPVNLPWAEAAVTEEGESIIFGLSRGGHLYANSRLLEKNCTSFLVTRDHLVYTTTSHLIKFVHMETADDLQVPPDDPENDERCRSIERGARLVTAIPSTMSLVLQMPRGNLETIHPRAMVIAGIRQLIDAKNYGQAFSYCRTQRVDMNLLCDHQPDQFLACVGQFLDQLKDPTYIDLFLSSLKNEDVTTTIYRDTKRPKNRDAGNFQPSHQEPTVVDSASKVNRICDAVLKGLATRKDASLQNIITANVCKDPPALDDGLRIVAKIMQEDETLAERAVEHICFLADVNKIYDHAMGLYDLDLTLLVAQQSQRDPREYLPFVQNLQQLPELRRRYAIDDHLGRCEKALEHLKALNVFDEVCTYTTKHKLFQPALRLYRYDEAHTRALTDLYAAHLESTSDFRQAGLAYESLGNYAKASSCYRAAGAACWQECLAAAQMQTPPPSAEALASLAATLADALTEAKDHAAAATIQLEYLAAPEAAVRSLCRGSHFAEAIRLATSTRVSPAGNSGLLVTAVDAGLTEALASFTEFLADCRAQLAAQVPRVQELRRRAAEDPLAFYEGEQRRATTAEGGDLPDDVSVVASDVSRLSTSNSLFTRYTGKGGGSGSIGTAGTGVSRASSRNRRREEKKRARGRKGTVYEEEYLVNSVRRLVERVGGGARGEVERLVFALVRRGMAERARAVEALLSEVLEGCRRAVEVLWPTTTTATTTTRVPEAGLGMAGAIGVNGVGGDKAALGREMEGDTGLAGQQAAPVVPSMARLSLLG